MKKYDEGYALPFVLVVLMVMMVLAVGVMDFSLRNLESQKNTTLRMQEKYEAAAKIEEIISAASNKQTTQFPSTEALLFKVEEGVLYIASAGSKDSDVWVTAKFGTVDTEGQVSGTVSKGDGISGTLTVSNTINLLEYKIANREAAWEYVGYVPKPNTPGGTP